MNEINNLLWGFTLTHTPAVAAGECEARDYMKIYASFSLLLIGNKFTFHIHGEPSPRRRIHRQHNLSKEVL
jgi:hypothetical protein